MSDQKSQEGAVKPVSKEAARAQALRDFLAPLRRLFSGEEVPPEEAKAGAEEANKALPEAVSARKAIEEDRRRKALIDRQLADDPSVYRRQPGSKD